MKDDKKKEVINKIKSKNLMKKMNNDENDTYNVEELNQNEVDFEIFKKKKKVEETEKESPIRRERSREKDREKRGDRDRDRDRDKKSYKPNSSSKRRSRDRVDRERSNSFKLRDRERERSREKEREKRDRDRERRKHSYRSRSRSHSKSSYDYHKKDRKNDYYERRDRDKEREKQKSKKTFSSGFDEFDKIYEKDFSGINKPLSNDRKSKFSDKPTTDNKDLGKINKKLIIPKNRGFNFVGFLIGHKGSYQKELERKSGCKIIIKSE